MNRLGLGFVLSFALLVVAVGSKVNAQEEVVILGNSPSQQNYLRSYWEQLRNTRNVTPPSQSVEPVARNGRLRSEFLRRNLRVRDLRLVRIIKLNGSSEVMGILTNRNRVPVTVLSVNYRIFDAFGNLVQTGSAPPEPSTIGAGQSVTFSQTLWTIPVDGGYDIQLAKPAFTLDESALANSR